MRSIGMYTFLRYSHTHKAMLAMLTSADTV